NYIYTLALHVALPILPATSGHGGYDRRALCGRWIAHGPPSRRGRWPAGAGRGHFPLRADLLADQRLGGAASSDWRADAAKRQPRSEEITSELQSQSNL